MRSSVLAVFFGAAAKAIKVEVVSSSDESDEGSLSSFSVEPSEDDPRRSVLQYYYWQLEDIFDDQNDEHHDKQFHSIFRPGGELLDEKFIPDIVAAKKTFWSDIKKTKKLMELLKDGGFDFDFNLNLKDAPDAEFDEQCENDGVDTNWMRSFYKDHFVFSEIIEFGKPKSKLIKYALQCKTSQDHKKSILMAFMFLQNRENIPNDILVDNVMPFLFGDWKSATQTPNWLRKLMIYKVPKTTLKTLLGKRFRKIFKTLRKRENFQLLKKWKKWQKKKKRKKFHHLLQDPNFVDRVFGGDRPHKFVQARNRFLSDWVRQESQRLQNGGAFEDAPRLTDQYSMFVDQWFRNNRVAPEAFRWQDPRLHRIGSADSGSDVSSDRDSTSDEEVEEKDDESDGSYFESEEEDEEEEESSDEDEEEED